MVRSRRLELPRPFGHNDLNVARLPVPPRPHIMMVRTGPAPGRSGRLAKLAGRCKRASPLLFLQVRRRHARGHGACHQSDSKESCNCHRSGVRPSSNHPSGGVTGGEGQFRSPAACFSSGALLNEFGAHTGNGDFHGGFRAHSSGHAQRRGLFNPCGVRRRRRCVAGRRRDRRPRTDPDPHADPDPDPDAHRRDAGRELPDDCRRRSAGRPRHDHRQRRHLAQLRLPRALQFDHRDPEGRRRDILDARPRRCRHRPGSDRRSRRRRRRHADDRSGRDHLWRDGRVVPRRQPRQQDRRRRHPDAADRLHRPRQCRR